MLRFLLCLWLSLIMLRVQRRCYHCVPKVNKCLIAQLMLTDVYMNLLHANALFRWLTLD